MFLLQPLVVDNDGELQLQVSNCLRNGLGSCNPALHDASRYGLRQYHMRGKSVLTKSRDPVALFPYRPASMDKKQEGI